MKRLQPCRESHFHVSISKQGQECWAFTIILLSNGRTPSLGISPAFPPQFTPPSAGDSFPFLSSCPVPTLAFKMFQIGHQNSLKRKTRPEFRERSFKYPAPSAWNQLQNYLNTQWLQSLFHHAAACLCQEALAKEILNLDGTSFLIG